MLLQASQCIFYSPVTRRDINCTAPLRRSRHCSEEKQLHILQRQIYTFVTENHSWTDDVAT